MKKRTFIMGLAALALAFGSAGVIGGVSLSANDSAVMTKAAVGDDIKIGEGTYKEIYRTGFESATAGTDYQSTQKYDSTAGDGLAWEIYFGTVSKTGKISGNNSAHMRLYSNKTDCYGYLMNTTVLDDYVDAVQFTYCVSNTSVKFNVDYSIDDGTTWNTIESVSPASTSSITYTHEFDKSLSNFRLRIVVTEGFPKTKNNTFRVDDVIFAKDSTKSHVNVKDGSSVALTNGSTKEFTLKKENLPEGGTITAEVGDTSIASVTLSEDTVSITALKAGDTTYSIVMKDADGKNIASFAGNISVTVCIEEVNLTSTFSNGETLRIGRTYSLNTSVAPSTASQEIVWTISDKDAVTISSENVLSIVKKTGTEAITITATSAADSTKSATLSFYVSNDFAISELLSQDGSTLPNGLINKSSIVSTTGTVTAIEGTNVYVQSGTSAIELFTYGTELSTLKIGDGVRASGTITLYNGITELASPTATVDETVKEDIQTLEFTKSDMVVANTNRLVTAHNAKCLASQNISGEDTLEVSFELSDGTPFTLYIKSTLISTVSSFGDLVKDNYYDIQGIYCLYKGSESNIYMGEGCSYYAAGTEEVKKFIADYITGKDGKPAETDSCKAKYDAAKAAYDKLSDNAKTLFTTGSDYAEAYKTYTYWEAHQNDTNGAKLVNSSTSTNWTNLAVIGGAFLLAAGASVYFFLNKKKQDR